MPEPWKAAFARMFPPLNMVKVPLAIFPAPMPAPPSSVPSSVVRSNALSVWHDPMATIFPPLKIRVPLSSAGEPPIPADCDLAYAFRVPGLGLSRRSRELWAVTVVPLSVVPSKPTLPPFGVMISATLSLLPPETMLGFSSSMTRVEVFPQRRPGPLPVSGFKILVVPSLIVK